MDRIDSSTSQVIQLIVSGRVQGVGFRYFVKTHATKLGISGLVKNQSNGTVLIIAQGSRQSLKEFLDYIHQGPVVAEVETVAQQILNSEEALQYQTFLSSGSFLIVR